MNFEQYLLEKYINQGLITQEEFDQMVEDKRKESSILTLQQENVELRHRQDDTEPYVERIKTPTEIYEENKNKDNISLVDLKQLRISKLKEECTIAIEEGFEVDGAFFGFNTTHDQSNFTQQLLLIVAGHTEPIQWKTKNKGVIVLSVEEFGSVIKEAEQHKRREQAKYWELEQAIIVATTKEEVDSITW